MVLIRVFVIVLNNFIKEFAFEASEFASPRNQIFFSVWKHAGLYKLQVLEDWEQGFRDVTRTFVDVCKQIAYYKLWRH